MEASDSPRGRRRRRSYRLTAHGEDALDGWLRSTGELSYELRDEGLLKLFFSEELPATARLNLLRRMRRRHELMEAQLRDAGAASDVVSFGIAHHRFVADWCRAREAELARSWSPGVAVGPTPG